MYGNPAHGFCLQHSSLVRLDLADNGDSADYCRGCRYCDRDNFYCFSHKRSLLILVSLLFFKLSCHYTVELSVLRELIHKRDYAISVEYKSFTRATVGNIRELVR